jgi:hypothetical protein
MSAETGGYERRLARVCRTSRDTRQGGKSGPTTIGAVKDGSDSTLQVTFTHGPNTGVESQ